MYTDRTRCVILKSTNTTQKNTGFLAERDGRNLERGNLHFADS